MANKKTEKTELNEVVAPKEQPKGLFKKIMGVMQYFDDNASSFEKDGYNKAQGYEYVKVGQYRTHLRKACVENGLIFTVNVNNVEMLELKGSEKMHLIKLSGTIVLTDIDNGDSHSYTVQATGSDNMDKGLSKAQTMLIKDFIKANFLVSDGEKDDSEGEPNINFTPLSVTTQRVNTVSNLTDKKATVQDCEGLTAMINEYREKSGNADYGTSVLKTLNERDANGNPTLSYNTFTLYMAKVEDKLSEV